MSKQKEYTIIQDTREQNGYNFTPWQNEKYKSHGCIHQKLDTGDYTAVGLEDVLCIERKASVSEFSQNVGFDKGRFFREMDRLKEFEYPFLLLEFSIDDLMRYPEGSGIPRSKWSKVILKGPFMLKRLLEIQCDYGIYVIFCGDKQTAKRVVETIIRRYV